MKRKHGRKNNEMRKTDIKVGILQNTDGSASFRFGNTYAIAGVYGPRRLFPKKEEMAERANLRIRYNMAAFSTETRNRPGTSRRSTEISMVIREAIESLLFTEEFPKAAIDLTIEIIEADASTRCAGVNAASLALADAGVPMKDLVASCSAGKVDGKIVLDIEGKEDTEGELDMPVAYCPFNNQVTLLQMDGLATKKEVVEILNLAINGCMEIHEKMKKVLREKYLESG